MEMGIQIDPKMGIFEIFDKNMKFWTFLIWKSKFCIQKSKFSDFYRIYAYIQDDSIKKFRKMWDELNFNILSKGLLY